MSHALSSKVAERGKIVNAASGRLNAFVVFQRFVDGAGNEGALLAGS